MTRETARQTPHDASDLTAHLSAPIIAGVVSGIVGFTSSFAVVLTGLTAVGASSQQAAAGLFVVSILMGIGCIAFSLSTRMPITMAWSTPGAALLAGATAPSLGWAGAVFAFMLAGALIALTGFIKPLGAIVAKIPAPLANAMLAGVLLTLCLAPFRALMESPHFIAPVAITWLVMQRIAPRWAVPTALGIAIIISFASGTMSNLNTTLLPTFSWQNPAFDAGAILSLAVPLYLVTMTSQNITGLAVMRTLGFEVKPRGPLLYTGIATLAAAPLGAFMLNLSAIAAALAAGPESHPNPRKRWIAGVATGVTYLVFGLFANVVTGAAAIAPPGMLETIAGLALLTAFGTAATGALTAAPTTPESSETPAAQQAHARATHLRSAAILTLVVAASGIHFWGIGAALWSLLAGMGYLAVLQTGRRGHKAA